MSRTESSLLYDRIYTLVHQVPPGHVTTYGQIGRLAGCTAHTVGFAMAALPVGSNVPWQRVVNSEGRISPRVDNDSSLIQRHLLEAEGICFDSRERIDLERYCWTYPQRHEM